MEHSSWVSSVAFSPDGNTILTGSTDSNGASGLWDAATGSAIRRPLLEHPQGVSSVAFSPDGRSILTGCDDGSVRLWDAASGQPIGPPLTHWTSAVGSLRSIYSPDGRFLLTHEYSAARLWDAPAPLPDDVPRLASWVEAATGLALDERGSIQVLDRAAWLERRERLVQLGGPPPADPLPLLDPIVFGANPTARGDAWKERGLWDRAEDAYIEAIRARPLNQSVWLALARLHFERGRLDQAVATLAEAVRKIPEDLELGRAFGTA